MHRVTPPPRKGVRQFVPCTAGQTQLPASVHDISALPTLVATVAAGAIPRRGPVGVTLSVPREARPRTWCQQLSSLPV